MNQTDHSDDEKTESLADLPLTGEQAEETRGGATTAGRFTLTFSGQVTESI
jgi:hypothetical protein